MAPILFAMHCWKIKDIHVGFVREIQHRGVVSSMLQDAKTIVIESNLDAFTTADWTGGDEQNEDTCRQNLQYICPSCELQLIVLSIVETFCRIVKTLLNITGCINKTWEFPVPGMNCAH